MNKAADQVVAIASGHPGPFFGRKRVNPSMKDARMETDCGGAIITKATLTYGQADEIASAVNTQDVADFIRTCSGPGCYWPGVSERMWRGNLWWAIYSYLCTVGAIEGNPQSYNNALEYLFGLVLNQLVSAGLLRDVDGDCRFFAFAKEEQCPSS